MTASGQVSCPSPGSFVSVSGQFLVSAVTPPCGQLLVPFSGDLHWNLLLRRLAYLWLSGRDLRRRVPHRANCHSDHVPPSSCQPSSATPGSSRPSSCHRHPCCSPSRLLGTHDDVVLLVGLIVETRWVCRRPRRSNRRNHRFAVQLSWPAPHLRDPDVRVRFDRSVSVPASCARLSRSRLLTASPVTAHW